MRSSAEMRIRMYNGVRMPRKRYGFWIDEDLLAGLRIVKDRDGVPESEQIRRAIREWLKSKGVEPTGTPKRGAHGKGR